MLMTSAREDIRRFMIALDHIDQLYYQAVRRLGVKGNTFVLLYALADGQPHSQKQICEEWSVPRTTLNTIVQECQELGYLELLPTGGKEKDLRLTDSGQSWAAGILTPILEAEACALPPPLAHSLAIQMETVASALAQEFHRRRLISPAPPKQRQNLRGRDSHPAT